MPPSPEELGRLRAARQRKQQVVTLLAARRQQADATLTRLAATGAADSRLRAVREQLATISDQLEGAREELASVTDQLHDRRVEFDRSVVTPEAGIGALSTDVPVLLAPVRIETRFFPGELRVRIFPDVVHVDGHERALTAAEVEAGTDYWQQRWTTTDDADIAALWATVAASRSPGRMSWIVAATRPTNVDELGRGEPVFPDPDLRPPGPSRAPVAQALPTRWLVTGIRDGEEVVRRWGRIVPEDLPVGPRPVPEDEEPDDHTEVPDEQDELPLDEDVLWLTDYDHAVDVGMAVTIREADIEGGSLTEGFDELVVVGIDWTRTPQDAAADLDRLVTAHAHTRGFSFVPPGTPTNAGSGTPPPAPGPPADPSVPAQRQRRSAADRFATAVGLTDALDPGLLIRLDGADTAVNPYAEAMATALWEPTIGYFLRQWFHPATTESGIAATRRHVRQWVRPRGPLPLVRIGQQPYGILPVMAPDGFAGSEHDERLHDLLSRMRRFWAHRPDGVSRLGASGDPSEDLVELLGRAERSRAVRLRQAVGAGVATTIAGSDRQIAMQTATALLLLLVLGVEDRPRIVDLVVSPTEKVLPIALTQPGGLSEGDPLTDNYIAAIRALLSTRASVGPLREQADTATSLLEALLAHAASSELSRAGLMLVLDRVAADTGTVQLGRFLADEEIRVTDDEGAVTGALSGDQAGSLLADAAVTPSAELDAETVDAAERLLGRPVLEMIDSTIPTDDDDTTIADRLTGMSVPDLEQQVFGVQLGQFRSALATLETAPSAELERSFAETLDITSHRIDAWITSLAAKRLHELRAQQATGIHLGGFGWVENVRPRDEQVSAGFVHAPSVAHATTAAVLRSGHLSHGAAGVDGDDEWLAIGLDSRRVRAALELLDGVRSGQPVGALLGYRFERGLRDLSPAHAAHILEFRQRFPMAGRADQTEDGEVLEVAGVGDVVDGAALADLDDDGLDAAMAALDVDADHRPGIRRLVARLADALDAVGDLLVAEGVHQAVLGNTERAAAAMDALDRQLALPDVDVVATPRTGRGFTHRVLAVLRGELHPDWATDTRSRLAPELNAWVGRLLGDPGRYVLAVDAVDGEGTVRQSLRVGLDELGLSPLSAVLATRRGDGGGSELEQRVNAFLAADLDPAAIALVAAGDDSDGRDRPIGLDEFVWRADRISDAIASSRPATARDFVPPEEFPETDPGVDLPVARARAAAAASTVAAAAAGLSGVDETTTEDALREALGRAADLGIRGAVPVGDRDQLLATARELAPRLAAMATEAATLGTPIEDNARLEAARCRSLLQAVLGPDVPPVLPVTVPSTAGAEIRSSSVDRPMVEAAGAEVADFLFQHALVRPGVARLQAVLEDAESVDLGDTSLAGTAELHVAQLPHVPGDPWICSPLPEPGRYPAGQLGMVVHDPSASDQGDGLDLGPTVVALVMDQWLERVPNPSEVTGVSFHFDAPGARPPQSMLLAVPSDTTVDGWSSAELVAVVREALALARIRTLDLDDISVGRILPATYVPFNLDRDFPALNFAAFLPLALEAVLQVQTDEEDS